MYRGAPPVAIKTDKTATVQLLLFHCLRLCCHCWKQKALPRPSSSSSSLLLLPYCSIDLLCLDWEWQTAGAIWKVAFVRLLLAAARYTHSRRCRRWRSRGVMATHKGRTHFHKVVPWEEQKHVWGGVLPCTYTHFRWRGSGSCTALSSAHTLETLVCINISASPGSAPSYCVVSTLTHETCTVSHPPNVRSCQETFLGSFMSCCWAVNNGGRKQEESKKKVCLKQKKKGASNLM